MTVEIPDLWSSDIRVDVLLPVTILRAQDASISRKTQGALRTDVRTVDDTDENSDPEESHTYTKHTLRLNAPVLAYTEDLLSVRHRTALGYPAELSVPDALEWNGKGEASRRITAYSSDDLIRYLRLALQSRDTRAVIDSLLARSNETGSPT